MKLRWLVKEYPGGIKSPPVLQQIISGHDEDGEFLMWQDVPTEVIQMEVREPEKGEGDDQNE